MRLARWVVLFVGCIGGCYGDAAVPTAPTVANPLTPGVTCEEREVIDADAASDCQARFDKCTDGLHYELNCKQGRCACMVDGVQQGLFVPSNVRCDVEIGQVKIACGWVVPGSGRR